MASRLSRASARSDIRVMSCPSSQISPPVGRSSPPSRYSRVDLPQPLGPIMATVSPRATSRSTSSTARTKLASRPYSLRSPRVRSTQLPPSGSFMTRPSGLSSSARMPPASADRPADAARCPPAAVRPAERSGSAMAARCASRSRRSSSRRWVSMIVIGSARPAAAAAISLRWNSARSGFGQLTSASQSATRCAPAGVSAYTLRSGRSGRPGSCSASTRPAFSSRVSVT